MRFWSRFRPLVPLVVLWATTSMVSPHALSAPQANCTGDINGDGVVNGVDLAQVLATWGPCPQYAPLVSSVSPNQGLPSGGTTITIRGQHLGRTSQVLIGGVPATGLAILDDQTVRAVTPAGVLGVRDLSLSTPAGSTVFGAAFTYTTMPWAEVLEVAPNPAVVPDASLRLAIFQTGLPWRVRDVGTGIEMLLIPPGTFTMGASPGDAEALTQEFPAHQVTLTNPYYMGRTEVTQAQWNAVMPFNYSRFPGNPDRPIEDVAWLAAKDFCQRTGLRLPSEAEWEHACRAGSSTPRYGPVNDISWHSGNIGVSTPRPVALKLPNGFGLYDMLGNVWEVMEDWAGAYTSAAVTNPTGPASGNFRIFRGGSRLDSALWMRTSSRLESPMATIGHCGFRVARNP